MEKVTKTKEEKKLSYEQLNDLCTQLSAQSQELYKKLQESYQYNMFKRLDYLFRVLDASTFFDEEFVDKCSDEIVMMMELPKENEVDTKAKGKETKNDK